MLIASFLCHFNIVIRGINRLCPPISRHIPCKRIPCFCKCSFQYLSFFCPCISLSCFRLLRRSPFRRYRFLHTKGKFAPWAVRTTISERSPVGKRMSTGLLLYGAPEKTKRENQSSQFFRQAKEHVLPKTVLHRTASCWKNSLVGVFFGQERVIRCASFRRPQELQQGRPPSIRRGGIR